MVDRIAIIDGLVAKPDPIDLARWELARDEATARRFPGMLEQKLGRMAASPLAYLRGSARLFYRVLEESAELAEGPEGEGWICGDAHVENFGAFRTEARGAGGAQEPEERVVFDVNDFDETVIAPWRYDVLRLVTSLILGGREIGSDGRQSLSLAKRLVVAYVAAAFGDGEPGAPRPIQRLLAKVEGRSHRDLLEKRTEIVGGRRRFKIGTRYARLPPDIEAQVPAAFERYVRGLSNSTVPSERFEILDAAFRIAGTGSLGTLRVAVLTRGKGDAEGGWLFDMKEETAPSFTSPLVPAAPGERVVTGVRACLERPPRMIGSSEITGTPLFVRRLLPQEDKLDLSRLDPAALGDVAAYLGTLLGRAHHRAATRRASAPWSQSDQDTLIDRAIVLAGLHEAAYLAMCKVVPA